MRCLAVLLLIASAVACQRGAESAAVGSGTQEAITGDAGLFLEALCQVEDGDRPAIAPEVETSLECVEGEETDDSRPLFTNDVGELPPEYGALHALCARMDPTHETRDDRTDPRMAADVRAYFRSVLARPALVRALAGLPEDPEARLDALARVWLGKNGFEHVFCGERNANGSVGGLHLWSELYLAEREGRVNYRCRRGPSDPAVLAVRFEWQPPGRTELARKPFGSMVPGMSPACLLAVGYAAATTRLDPAARNSSFSASLYGASRPWILSVQEDGILSIYPTALAP